MDSDREKRMMQYLLGQLAEQEQAQLEARYLADDACFDELLMTEDALRDAYARGELSGSDREAFEQRLLATPQQRQKQEFARTLRKYLVEAPVVSTERRENWVRKRISQFRQVATRHPIVLLPALSTILLLVAAGWWLEHRSGRLPVAAPAASTAQPPASSLQKTRVIAFVLTPGFVRGSEPGVASLVIPLGVSRVRLEAPFEADYPEYEAVLSTAENKPVWSANKLRAQPSGANKTLSVEIPVSLLRRGDYILSLHGVPVVGMMKTVAEYAFRVDRQ
jgi:anti-sigma factor RsiW